MPQPNYGEFQPLGMVVNGVAVDDYELGPPLSDEPVARTYRGRRKSDGAAVLIRCLSASFEAHPAVFDQVRQDVGAWVGFEHPGALDVWASGTSHGRAVIVYQNTDDPTLETLLGKRGSFPVREASEIVRDLASLLVGAEHRGLFAGDIRASKVHLGVRPRLADLGLARATAIASGLGRFGLHFGHPGYLAPEVLQIGQREPTAASAVYALGVLYYQLICGRLPFLGDPQRLLEQHFDQPLPPPDPGVEISSAVGSLITGMTAKRVQARLTSGQAFAALSQVVEGSEALRLPPMSAEPELITPDGWDQVHAEPVLSGRWSSAKIAGLSSVGPEVLEAAQASMRIPANLLAEVRGDVPGHAGGSKKDVRLGDKIGRGVAGTVYSATVGGQDGDVVVKVLSRMYSKHADLYERVIAALGAATKLRHPRVIALLEMRKNASSQGERDLLVMERADGQTLRRQLKAGRLSPDRSAAVITDVAEALEAAADLGLSHGDVCPEKIYVDAQGRASLADFGHAEASCLGAGLGKFGLPFGRPNYLAPEILQEGKKTPDPASDIYSLGIVLYELLTGAVPFSGSDPKQTLLGHLQKPLPRPPDDVAVPRHIAEVLARMTAKSPKKRLLSLAEVRSGLVKPKVEEFNPLSTRDSFTSGEWSSMQELAAKSRDETWTREALLSAERVGPDAFKASDANLVALVEAARAQQKAGRGGRARSPAGRGGSLNLGGLLVAVGGLAVVGLVVAGIVLTQEGPKRISGKDIKRTPATTPEADKKKELETRIATAIADCEAEVAQLLAEGQFKKAHQIGARVDSGLRRERKIERAVQRLEREALRASSARTRDVRTSVFALLEAGKLTQAAKEVEELARVAIEAAGVDAIRKRLNERRDAEVGPVRALEGTAPFDARKARKVLAASLKGWGAGGQLFDGGGVALRYTDMNALAKDLRHVRGSTLEKARAPVRGRPVALQIKAPRGEPAVFVLPKLPLERILDVTLEVVLAKAPSGSTQVAILVGTDADVARGGGFTFGVVPVQVLNSKLASQSSVAIPPIPDLVPMRLRVELPDDGDRARARGMLSLPSTEHRASGSLTVSTRGAVAIYVEDAEVWITSLEVRGLLDASSLR